MEVSQSDIAAILSDFRFRCEMARAAGGLPLVDAMEGAPIPPGWYFDSPTGYFLPPNFQFAQSMAMH